ncbi:hypothetical protein [Citrobacter portucalensis]|nr:hypothetical protein [Citrobacter portucalensis]
MIAYEIEDYQRWYHEAEQSELEAAYIAAYKRGDYDKEQEQ